MRDTSFTITKALAIILVVLSHAGAPGWINDFIYQFHVPVFFICAGFFFNLRYLDDERTYVIHRLKGLYLPFLRWSLLFLLLHNVFFFVGLLSEQYGNPAGGVTHPYAWHDFAQRLWSITFNMSGYDEFLGGTFWFFRALLLSSIGFLVLFKIIKHLRPTEKNEYAGGVILTIAFLLALWQTGEGLRITGVAQGGYREITGLLFISVGFLFRQYRERIVLTWKPALAGLIVAILGAVFCPNAMGYSANPSQFLALLLPAVGGSLALYYTACKVQQWGGIAARSLIYIGERTLYIFAFHLLAFKVISAVKVAWYGLPWQAVGGHTVVNHERGDAFWVAYVVVGVFLPLLWLAGYRRLALRYDFSLPGCLRGGLRLTFLAIHYLLIGIKWFGLFLWRSMQGIVRTSKEIISASNPKDE